ncbi:hypothetical protein DSECCO2_505360 [anaerobic digester metagenome]
MARRREFEGVSEQVDEDLAQADGIAAHLAGQVAGQEAEQFEALLGGGEAQGAHGAFDGGAKVEVARLQLELAGLDLGQVQHAVDQVQQRLGGRLDDVQGSALLGAQFRVQDHVRHSDDGVHGRADLVAEIGQELRFHAAGGLGLPPGFVQFGHQSGQVLRVLGQARAFGGHEASPRRGALAACAACVCGRDCESIPETASDSNRGTTAGGETAASRNSKSPIVFFCRNLR